MRHLGNGGLGRSGLLFHGLGRHHEDSRLWLRYPLRFRPVPSEDRRRLSGGNAGLLVAPGIPLDVRADISFMYPVHFYGHVTSSTDKHGRYRARWTDTEIVMAMACDMLVPGFGNDHVINMRLWRAKASRELDLRFFNVGDYINAVEGKVKSETISKVLYPVMISVRGRNCA